ncbi:MAG: helix-turn-helix transcriptional regulator, partial [Bacilli bacterium]|nr:helix-turn-helix transcriptional regulator [Bacilli bacterium]
SKIIGQRIKIAREERKFTQKQLAEKLSISFQAVSKWENGESFPDLGQLVALSELFKISLDQLIKENAKEQVVKKEYKFYETIKTDSIEISLLDFYMFNTESTASLLITNKTNKNMSINPSAFALMGNDQEIIKPVKAISTTYNVVLDEDIAVSVGLKHEIPQFIPPKKEAKINLYFEFCSQYPYVTLYPSVSSDLTSFYFIIPRVVYQGFNFIINDQPRMGRRINEDDFHIYVDYLIFKNEHKKLIEFLIFQQRKIDHEFIIKHNFRFLPEDRLGTFNNLLTSDGADYLLEKKEFVSFEFLLYYGKTDEYKREGIKSRLNEFEDRCKDRREEPLLYCKELQPFMDEELILFIAKMWLKYGKKLIDWAIPHLDEKWIIDMREEVLKIDPYNLIVLYSSKAKPECINEIIIEKLTASEELNVFPIGKVVRFIEKAQHRLTSENIEKILLSKQINSIESLRLIKPYLKSEVFDKMLLEISKNQFF